MRAKFLRNISFGVIGIVLVVLTSICIVYFTRTKGVRNITFSDPLIAIKDSTNAYIFDKNSSERYSISLDDDILDKEISRNEDEIVYSVKPKYRPSKYHVFHTWSYEWPTFSDKEAVEHYQSYVIACVRRIDIKLMIRSFLMYGYYDGSSFSSLFRTSYVNILPDRDSWKCPKDNFPHYYISLDTKPYVLLVPDFYWLDEDVLNDYSVLVDISSKAIRGEKIGVTLGEFDVWKSSDFHIEDYSTIIEKIDNEGRYAIKLIWNKVLYPITK